MKYNRLIVLAVFRDEGLPEPNTEYRFHPDRRFEFDFAWPARKIALEVEGGIFMGKGGHSSITGIKRDIEKYNLAAVLGWRVYRVIPQNLCMLETINDLKRMFGLL